jgi:hypothetical protein
MNRAQEVDPFIVDEVRNFLFGEPGSGGFDLASLNIQRGRDHGLPRYNAMRVQMGLAAKLDFADVSSDPDVQARLALVYDSVDDIDLWVGGLCEDHAPGAMVGELLKAILTDQFQRLRDGDRFWYANHFNDAMVQELEQTTLAQIIRRNTSIGKEIPDDVFLVEPVVVAAGDGSIDIGGMTIGEIDAKPADLQNDSSDRAENTAYEVAGRSPSLRLGSVFPNPARTHVIVQVPLDATASSSATSSGGATAGDPSSGRMSTGVPGAQVSIYDVRGRLVRTLRSPPGTDALLWNLETTTGTRVPRGTYLVRVQTAREVVSHKILVLD